MTLLKNSFWSQSLLILTAQAINKSGPKVTCENIIPRSWDVLGQHQQPYYNPTIWHYCGKLAWINQSCLHFIFNEYHSSYDKLLSSINNWPSLHNRRIHDMLTLVYKSFHGLVPSYINELLIERNSSYNLRGKHSLSIPRVQSTKYGLHSFCYSASKYWNMLPEARGT